MAAANGTPSSQFVNPNNRGLALLQLGTRPAGTTPLAIVNLFLHKGNSSPEDHQKKLEQALEKEIKPVEKTAVLYGQNIDSSTITTLFLQTLKHEKRSSLSYENLESVLKTKDLLLRLIQKFSGVDHQLNCLKILGFRLAANCIKLLKDKDFCLNFNRFYANTSSSSAQQESPETRENTFKKTISKFLEEMFLIELTARFDLPKLSGSFQMMKDLKQSLDSFFDLSLKNQRIKETVQEIQNDLGLVLSLSLAPQTLIPLAISTLKSKHSPNFSPGSQELEELLSTQFLFVCDMIETICTKRSKELGQKGSHAKKCKEALQEFLKTFKEEYQRLRLELTQSYQSIFNKIHPNRYVSSSQHVHTCQEIQSPLKLNEKLDQLEKAYSSLSKLLAGAPSLPKFDVLKKDLAFCVEQHLLRSHVAFVSFYKLSILKLEINLKNFSQAYQQYVQYVPHEQREMQAGLYTPLDLIYFNILEAIIALFHETQQPSIHLLMSAMSLNAEAMASQAKHYYQSSLLLSLNEEEVLLRFLAQGAEEISKAKQASQQEAPFSNTATSLVEKIESLLNCLRTFVKSSSAYPFLCNYLGSQEIQPHSYEHSFSAILINFIYQQLHEKRARFGIQDITTNPQALADHGFDASDVALSGKQPVKKGSVYLISPTANNDIYFQQLTSLSWQERFFLSIFTKKWENIPMATPLNISEVSLPFARLMRYFEGKWKELSMAEFVEESESIEAATWSSVLQRTILTPYESLKRYLAQLSLEDKRSQQIQNTAQPLLLQNSTSSVQDDIPEESSLVPIHTLRASLEQIGQTVAVLAHRLDTSSCVDMRDFYSQTLYHLQSIEDLLTKNVNGLSTLQLQALLVHQAYALEQSVKLAAVARLPQETYPESLKTLLRSSHRTSEFCSFLSPTRSDVDPCQWNKTLQTVSSVDGFLIGPSRYALVSHPWMGLLADLAEQETKPFAIITLLMQDNLLALQLLFSDILHSLPTPQISSVVAPPSIGYLEGLMDKKALQLPEQPSYASYSVETLLTALDPLLKIEHVPHLSRYETTTHLIQRRQTIHANLYIIRVNMEQLTTLLQVEDSPSWCSTYSSTLLLRAAAVLEKSLQTLLCWLPVPSASDPDQHYLFSTRPATKGRAVPLRHVHSIKDNALLCAKHLAPNSAQSLENIGDQFSWLDPFIQQLYRYPFSPLENRSSHILQLFHALAYVRRSLYQEDRTTQDVLKKELSISSENLRQGYDQLIQSHLNVQIIAPVHEILKASQEIIVKLVQLSNSTTI